ncbi:stage II sporulation protein M [Anatilimnocola sp. NA78]|uniref:stage II sporulation protein M n=1 Tax=Anatilimnocola sp. NA78 TaxID=3415683 RepID=UPI003CE53188
MKVVELLERRRKNWQELERYCARSSLNSLNTAEISRFSALYRAACADLALSNSYQLPENTVQYLHGIVGRAHNQLYRSKRLDFAAWSKMLLEDVPQRIFNDRCVQFMFCLFWGFFILSAWLAYSKSTWPDYAEQMMKPEMIEQLEGNFKNPIDGTGRDGDMNLIMAAFYIRHNTGIGLQCFVWGLLVVPGLYVTVKNALVLGAAFGYMARPDVPEGANFFHFVTAHGPFELTAIVLSAGAGLRLGLAWIMPGQLSRGASLQQTGKEMMPVMCSAMIMFGMAAFIEGFLSPSAAPYWIKAAVAIISSSALAFYFIVLGFPRSLLGATR